jgi:hypothetical protein
MLALTLPLALLALASLTTAIPILSSFAQEANGTSSTSSNATSPSPTLRYAACQLPKQQGRQLEGCPNGTIYVSQTDPQAKYGSIGTALEVRKHFSKTCEGS